MASNGQPTQQQLSRTGHAAVVGAGIAGLAAGIALRRAGWRVDLFERSEFKNETGAAITVTPNAALVLDRWGFDMARAEAVPNQCKVVALAKTPMVAVDKQVYADDDASQLGYGVWSLHRVDLHQELRLQAASTMADTGAGPPVQISLGCAVHGVDCEQGTLKLAGGRTVTRDLVIIADGAHSRLISDFVGHPVEARGTGRSMYRWLVPMDDVMVEPALRAIFSRELPGFRVWIDPVKDVVWVAYGCRGEKLLSVAAGHRTSDGQGGEGRWNAPVAKADVLETSKNFHPSLKKLVGMADADGIQTYHVYTRPPLDSFVRGRAVVVGDAAHAMKPTHAAAAGIAIESAASLEVLFRTVDIQDSSNVRQRLELFDKLRVPRCNLTMLASNTRTGSIPAAGSKEGQDLRRFYNGPLPPRDAAPYSQPCRELLFDHDEYQAAEELLAAAILFGAA